MGKFPIVGGRFFKIASKIPSLGVHAPSPVIQTLLLWPLIIQTQISDVIKFPDQLVLK